MKRLIGSIVVLAGAFSSSLLFAQGWCWGWGPECISSTSQDTGGVIDEAPSYTPPTVITLPDSWGAIAQSPTTGLWAKASKQVSKQASKQLALQNCASTGASDCKVLVTYKNTCIGWVASSTVAQYAHNPDLNVLRKQLFDGCSKASNGEQCKVVYEECMYDHLYHP